MNISRDNNNAFAILSKDDCNQISDALNLMQTVMSTQSIVSTDNKSLVKLNDLRNKFHWNDIPILNKK